MIEVRLERLSEEMEYGTVSRWLKGEGDAVTAGEPIAEVEAEKVTVEITAPVSGVLQSILAVQGDEFRGEVPIALIAQDA